MPRSESYEAGAADFATITIALNGTESTAFRLGSSHFLAFLFGTFTGATCTFKASTTEAGTYAAVVDDEGNAISITATDDRWVVLSSAVAAKLASLPWLKIVSAGAEAAERTVTVAMKRG